MENIFNASAAFLASVIVFVGQKEIISLFVGMASTAIWYRITAYVEQEQKNKNVINSIKSAISQIDTIAKINLGIANNEIARLSQQKLTLDPHSDFPDTSADLIFLLADFKSPHGIEVWQLLKSIESLCGKAQKISIEAMHIRRAIKLENRTEIYMFELIPYLKQHDEILANVLSEIIAKCSEFKVKIKSIRK
ncbi:hypothetical protein [Vogesella indigofera]|uniref:hypothetical protein n=1 Tax=Vogesella indigofera TaxID=45465 RepID=UPI00234E7DE9|nr:hypothetical protein [Vogesella indigofera]MDC7697306.1 hypothetical protein [Vogesella indigofera]